MKRLHVVGGKNHGKTLLVVELIHEFTRRGLRVGSIKHTHHSHELDVPGKDSYRHRTAGAAVVGILSPGMSAIFLPTPGGQPVEDDRYSIFEPLFAGCDLVLVEGDLQTTGSKIEVWRSQLGTQPLAYRDRSVLAVATDDVPSIAAEVLPRRDVPRLADWILNHLAADGR